jgi:hypothetical protein
VHQRFSRWAKSGVFERIFKLLASDHDNEYMMIDATIVRAHQHSADARKKTARKRSADRAVDSGNACRANGLCASSNFRLNVATMPEQMNLSGFDFHVLKGFVPTRYTVHVNGSWCITFEFDAGDAFRVDFEQYH